MTRVYIAAGSNIEPVRHLQQAVELLEQQFGPLTVSPWYRNRAVGFEGEDFINFAIGFDSTLSLPQVVERLREIETRCGRPRNAPKWAPRAMDLDILLYGDVVSADPHLPRPDLLVRPYMLGPLADIAPQLVHPTVHLTIGQLWLQFDRGHEMVPVAAAAVTA